jgi:hypothetical protein
MIPYDIEDACQGCFLYERRGVCPAARDAYGLQNSMAAERRAERFREAVAHDARSLVTLTELVRHDAKQSQPGPSDDASPPLALLSAADSHQRPNSRKEAVYVHAARPIR